jgi:hypothetical protein
MTALMHAVASGQQQQDSACQPHHVLARCTIDGFPAGAPTSIIAVPPAGVFVIDTKNVAGKVSPLA